MHNVNCEDCGWKGKDWETEYIEDIYDRVSPGDIMPWGQCPDCAALIGFKEKGNDNAD